MKERALLQELEAQLQAEPLPAELEAELTSAVVARPHDPAARLRLYSVLVARYVGGSVSSSALLLHLPDIIRAAPWSTFAASVGLVDESAPQHDDLKRAWRDVLPTIGDSPEAIANAADFFEPWDFERAGHLIERGMTLDSARFGWRRAGHELLGADLGVAGCSYAAALSYFEASRHGLFQERLSHPGLAALAAFEAGRVERSLALADEAFGAPGMGFDDDRHQAHTVRGLSSFAEHRGKASYELLASVVDRLTAQGPSLRLARRFALAGDVAPVEDYLRLLGNTWERAGALLPRWRQALADGALSALTNPGR